MGSWRFENFNVHLLPIGEGLWVTRMTQRGSEFGASGKTNHWIVKEDDT